MNTLLYGTLILHTSHTFSLLDNDTHIFKPDLYAEYCCVNSFLSYTFHAVPYSIVKYTVTTVNNIPIPEHRCFTVAVRCSWRSFHPHLPVIPLHLHFRLHVHFLVFLIRHFQNTLENTFKPPNLLITSPTFPRSLVVSSSPLCVWKSCSKMLRID